MGKLVLKDAKLSVNSVDLSQYVNQVAMDMPTDEVDLSGMGVQNKVFGRGLSDASITVTFLQDFALAAVDATLWPLSNTSTPFPVAVKATSAVISATNPEYQMSALLYNYAPISGSLGEAASTEVTFRNADSTGIVRDVTP
jgi:hypothetical protein